MDRPSTPSRSTILSADCRITDLLTLPSSWPVAADGPSPLVSDAVVRFVIAVSTSLRGPRRSTRRMLTAYVNAVDNAPNDNCPTRSVCVGRGRGARLRRPFVEPRQPTCDVPPGLSPAGG